MDKTIFHLTNDFIRARAKSMIDVMPKGFVVTISPPKRSLEQNARLWAMLAEVSERLNYHGRRLSPEDWKHIFTASLRGEELDAVPTLDGKRMILIGLRTSKMNKAEFSDLFAIIEMYAASKGLKLQDQREAA